MKKKIIGITVITVIAISATIGWNINKTPQLDLDMFLKNTEALASGEQTNPWESNYQYCRCKKGETRKIRTCQGGNATSDRGSCHKAPIGTTIHCHDHDDNCTK